MQLTGGDGRSILCNVEYNQLHATAVSRGRAVPPYNPSARAALEHALRREKPFERPTAYPLHVPGAAAPSLRDD